MYRELRGEMVKANISIPELASKIGVTEKTLRNKLNGETAFTLLEAQTVRKYVNKKMSLEELFVRENDKEKEVV